MLIKLFATASLVILVALAVGRLGPKLGGILAGTPVILGPGHFFMLREQPAEFMQEAVLSTLHALIATLLFTLCFVLTAGKLSALRSLSLASLLWVPFALVFTQLPGGLPEAIAVYLVVLGIAEGVNRWLRLGQPVVVAGAGWFDLLLRGRVGGGSG